MTVLNAKAPVVVASELINHSAAVQGGNRTENSVGAGVAAPSQQDDPRLAKRFNDQVLALEQVELQDKRVVLGYRTHSSGMTLGCGMDHIVETELSYTPQAMQHD